MPKFQILIIFLSLLTFNNCSECDDEIILREACSKFTSSTSGQGCYYDGSSCKSGYTACDQYTGTDSAICTAIVPLDLKYKCVIENSKCTAQLKKCEEYTLSYGQENCWNLQATTNGMSCILDGSTCKEAYKHCEDYTGDSIVQTTCENIKPFIKGTNDLDYSHKCVFENNKCITKQRECGDYDYSKDGNTYYCTRIKFDENSKKTCKFDDSNSNNCIENYLTCEAYTGKNEATCKAIEPYDDEGHSLEYESKCEIENEKCVAKPRKCEDYTSIPGYYSLNAESFCTGIYPSDKTKRCAYYSGQCVEVPKTCEQYTETTGNARYICEKIRIYDSNDKRDYSHKCVFEDNTCKTKQKACAEGTSYTCNYIVISDKKRCLYDGNNCIEIPKNCEDYEGNDRIFCESIEPFKSMYEKDEEYECVLEKDNKCTKKKIEEETEYCDYGGSDEDLCELHPSSDPNLKTCIIVGYSCVERYKYCSEYKGSTNYECTSITPFDPETGKKDKYSKCKMDSGKCVKDTKKCTEYSGSDPNECSKYHAESENKHCVFKGDQCKEEYKSCESFTQNDQTGCENIFLSDYSKKCVFQAASGSQAAKCVTTPKTCTEFVINDFKSSYSGNYCINHSLNDYKKKCSFSYDNYNNIGTCSDHTNVCSEITFSNESEATEEKCNAIVVSSGTCTLKRDKSGCRSLSEYELETEKEIEQGNKGGNNNNDNNNSGGKRYQIIFGLLVFLVLL